MLQYTWDEKKKMVPAFLFPKNNPPHPPHPPEMAEKQAILFTKGDVMVQK